MQTKSFSRKYYQGFCHCIFTHFDRSFLFTGSVPAATPIQTVVVPQEVMTQVVTQIVYVPVTVTPTPTPYITDTPHATLPLPPTAVTTPPDRHNDPAAAHRNCAGPHPMSVRSRSRLYQQVRHPGEQPAGCDRTQPGHQLAVVQGSDHKYPCWVKAALVKVDTGSFTDPPVTNPGLTPYTTLYPPPPAVSANRVGDDVTIFWLPVPMTEQDYNGYLIEAWVCQGGQLVFVPNELHHFVGQKQHHDGCESNGRSRLFRAFQRPHLYCYDQCLFVLEKCILPGQRLVTPTASSDCHSLTEVDKDFACAPMLNLFRNTRLTIKPTIWTSCASRTMPGSTGSGRSTWITPAAGCMPRARCAPIKRCWPKTFSATRIPPTPLRRPPRA